MDRAQEQELLRAIDIVELISQYVTLRRHGREYLGLCPFHSERTPSFSVNQEKGSWYCHGCHEGGNALWFLAKVEGISKGEAIRALAERQGISVKGSSLERDAAGEERRARLLAACAEAARFYQEQLGSPEAQAAILYMRGRGIDRACAGAFGLGFAPGVPDALFQKLSLAGFTLQEAVEAGLCAEGDFGPYDRMRQRLIIPIADGQGRPIAFGGRALGDGSPKYLNSPDTMLFHKSRTLYLLHRARRGIQKSGAVVVVEGYLDALMAHHYGIDNVVATLGTAITPDHVQVLRRLAKKVIFALDSDEAGARAVERASGLFADGEMAVQVASFPGGMDPDAYLRTYGPESFREKIATAVGIVEYRLAHILRSADLNSDEGKRTAVQECTKVLAGVASPLMRDRYVDDLARLWSGAQASTDELLDNIEVVREEIARQVRAGLGPRSSRTASHRLASAAGAKPRLESEESQAESELLAALMVRPSLLAHFEGFLSAADFRIPAHQAIFTLLEQEGSPEEWLPSLEDEESVKGAAKLLAQSETIVDPETTASDCFRKVKDFEKRLRFEELRRKFTEMAAEGAVSIPLHENEEYYQLSRYFKAS